MSTLYDRALGSDDLMNGMLRLPAARRSLRPIR